MEIVPYLFRIVQEMLVVSFHTALIRIHRIVKMITIGWKSVGIGDVLNVSNFSFEIGHPPPVVNEDATCGDDCHYGDDNAGDYASIIGVVVGRGLSNPA
jgi:hypothetical protein